MKKKDYYFQTHYICKYYLKIDLFQMDNCWRENKNKYMMSYLCHLVNQNIFKHVFINFFVVGHTHDDVDQMFSVLSRYFEGINAITIEDLHNIMFNAMIESIILLKHVQTFPNYSGWVQSERNVNNLSGYFKLLNKIGHSKVGSIYISK